MKDLKKKIVENMKKILKYILKSLSFFVIILVHLLVSIFQFIFKNVLKYENLSNTISLILKKFARLFDSSPKNTISRMDLVGMALENMQTKKSRTTVTIGGIAIGIGLIVFLVSIGYGLQELVTRNVASLQEMKQTDVSPQVGGMLKLTDTSMNDFKQIPNVEKVLPLISAVGHVNFQGSQSDIATYAVTTEYIEESDIDITNGEMFQSDELSFDVKGLTDTSSTLPMIHITSELTDDPQNVQTLILSDRAKKTAIVNMATLNILSVEKEDAVNKEISISFIIVGDLIDEVNSRVQSSEEMYTIVGVTSDKESPIMYIPFIDLRSLGISNYSQIKVVTNSSNNLNAVRRQIESGGYMTSSVADTVEEVDSIFQTSRTILALFGFIALLVASMGMFNTLTVSLLERTKEVGLMKAMGMKSSEVKDVFLTESMTLGIWGGMFGLILGYLAGQLVSLTLSLFSISNGEGIIDVTHIPFTFTFFIIVLSIFVGILTGIFPARRATKISALNALRYE
jgi:ABC-type antimicrobial peptide transport system permease subunit